MTPYVTPKGVKYNIEKSPVNHFMIFKQEGGGNLPSQLVGNFTSNKFLKEAWTNFMTALDKPDMRLKENKPATEVKSKA